MAKLTFPELNFTPYEAMQMLSTAMANTAKHPPEHKFTMSDILGLLIFPLQDQMDRKSGIPPWVGKADVRK